MKEPSRRGSRLVVFHIDGTLTDTNAVDDRCFLRAVGESLDLDVMALDWSEAPHVTDTGLLHWLAERHGRLPISDQSRATILERFVDLLDAERRASPSRFRPIAGAVELMPTLAQAGWACALATGGWERSARLKLAAAGLSVGDMALATSTDAVSRVEIMQLAVRRAAAGDPFDRIVSVGDGVWDVAAAAELGWPFVGIASGAAAARLRDRGAEIILADFRDVAAVQTALAVARPPRGTATRVAAPA